MRSNSLLITAIMLMGMLTSASPVRGDQLVDSTSGRSIFDLRHQL